MEALDSLYHNKKAHGYRERFTFFCDIVRKLSRFPRTKKSKNASRLCLYSIILFICFYSVLITFYRLFFNLQRYESWAIWQNKFDISEMQYRWRAWRAKDTTYFWISQKSFFRPRPPKLDYQPPTLLQRQHITIQAAPIVENFILPQAGFFVFLHRKSWIELQYLLLQSIHYFVRTKPKYSIIKHLDYG